MIISRAEPPVQLVTFRTGEYSFGVNVLDVQEVLRRQQMTRVPRAGHEVRGLINLRGHIVTAIGMRERLNLACAENEADQMNLIVSLKDGCASLVVDEVGDVIPVDPKLYKHRPSTLAAPLRDIVVGVYQLDHGLLLHIDPELACQVSQGEKDHA
jgi:purine-binding chemotaxis protein CheW